MDFEKAYKEALERARAGNPMDEVFPELKENEDERIRKALIKQFSAISMETWAGIPKIDIISWLEKQKENIGKEYVFRPLAGTDITIAAEQAVRMANEGDRLVLAFNGAYIPVKKGVSVNKIVDIYDAFIEKQKETSKAIEVVDRIDKYIDEHLANAHDMKDSNPDKKYYRGWDDALGKMAGILQDVYSGEKQKEQKPAEWSEEDKKYLNLAINIVASDFGEDSPTVSWLKDLPNRFALQPKQEWSKEDENFIKELCNLLASIAKNNYVGRYYAPDLVSKLQSLRPQPHWKPSEEQLDALLASYTKDEGVYDYYALESLYNDLKKLM